MRAQLSELVKFAFGLTVAYLIICLIAYFGHRQFIYFPDPTRVAPAKAGLDGVEEVEIKGHDGAALIAWYAAPDSNRPTLLYFHGNAANAANRAPKIERIRQSGFGVFYLNNRGYGGSEGNPTEKDNVADAIEAYDRLRKIGVPADRIIAYGESLGAGQAVRLAAERDVAAVVLEAPLTSTLDVARSMYFWLPLDLLITDKYQNEENIRSVTGPVLILHGEKDAVIPVEMGLRVYRAANQPKLIELLPQGRHNDLFDHGAWEKARAFLVSLAGGT